MAKWGNADYEQLKALQERLQKLGQVDLDKFCMDVSKELAARLLALVIPRTPVGQYPNETGKKVERCGEAGPVARPPEQQPMHKACRLQKAQAPTPLRL